MNINIDNDLFTNQPQSTNSRLMLLPKILKIVTILVGVLVSVLITVDLSENIFHSVKEESLRILSSTEKDKDPIESFNQDLAQPLYRTENITEEMERNHEYIKKLIEQQKELVVNFYNKIDRKTYRGTWKSEDKFNFLSEKTEGEMALRIEKVNTFTTFDFEKAFIVFRLLDGHYIDRWALIRAVNRPFWNISFTNTSISQNFSTFVDFGEIFEKIDYQDSNFTVESSSSAYCHSTIVLDWGAKSTENSTILSNISHILGSFNSNCGFNNITFELYLEKDDQDYYKVVFYSFVVSLLAGSQIFNTVWMIHKIADSQTFANSISLITVLQNIVWNAYGCLCHFFLTVNYDFYTLQFGIPAFLFFANFSVFEIKLLYTIWRIKNMRYINDQAILRKKLIQFYFFFYIIMFFSLFYVMKFFFEKPYIFTAIIFTWIPQIIYNTIYKNKLSMPLLNIVLICLNKIFLPFYFRGCPENFFQLSHDYSFIFLCFTCLFLETLLMYSQSAISPRWLLPRRYQESSFDFYKTKSEVLLIRPEAELHDCVICLFSLLSSENYKHFTDDFMAAGEKKKCVFEGCRESFWNFHEGSMNVNKKPYMMTPCRHFFHTPCLESWFKQKKECPSCRQEIDNVMI